MKLTNNTIGKIDLTFAAIRHFLYAVSVGGYRGEYEVETSEMAEKLHNLWEGSRALQLGTEFQWKSLFNRGGDFFVQEEDKVLRQRKELDDVQQEAAELRKALKAFCDHEVLMCGDSAEYNGRYLDGMKALGLPWQVEEADAGG